jgi:hypothetical protein
MKYPKDCLDDGNNGSVHPYDIKQSKVKKFRQFYKHHNHLIESFDHLESRIFPQLNIRITGSQT